MTISLGSQKLLGCLSNSVYFRGSGEQMKERSEKTALKQLCFHNDTVLIWINQIVNLWEAKQRHTNKSEAVETNIRFDNGHQEHRQEVVSRLRPPRLSDSQRHFCNNQEDRRRIRTRSLSDDFSHTSTNSAEEPEPT